MESDETPMRKHNAIGERIHFSHTNDTASQERFCKCEKKYWFLTVVYIDILNKLIISNIRDKFENREIA